MITEFEKITTDTELETFPDIYNKDREFISNKFADIDESISTIESNSKISKQEIMSYFENKISLLQNIIDELREKIERLENN